ncbi:MAG TPA: AI-2E family transporter [Opitutus sp.]|nr:AI-2E family transporter [Opitutus sp.]
MPDAPAPLLTPTQRHTVASALTLLAVVGSAVLIIGAFIVFGRLLGFFSGVLWPLAAAGVLALILRPVVDYVERRLKLRRLAAVIVLYGVFVLVVAGLLFAVLPPLIEQTLNFVAFLPSLWDNALNYVREHYPQWITILQREFDPVIRKLADTLASEARSLVSHALPSLRAAGGGVVGLFAFVTHVAIVPVYLFFFLLSRAEPTKHLPPHLTFLKPGVRDDVIFLLREFIAIVESFFRGQLVIGLIMGVLLAIGFTIVGLKFGLFIGLALGILNIVPYLGTIIGLAVALPLAFFQPEGGWQLVGLVLLVKIIVQAIEGWFLTPKIMGLQTGLHPVAIILAIFFWGTAFGGVLGMLLAIPLTAFFVTAWRLVRRKYFTAD